MSIHIGNMDKAAVLCALYNRGRVQGMGVFQAQPGNLAIDDAREMLKTETYFDYLRGRVMKVDLSDDELETRLYDRDNGQGAAEAALQAAGLLPASPPTET